MITFTMGRGAGAIEGSYDLENGITIKTPGAVAQDLAQTLEREVNHLIATSPHPTGAYAMALRVLGQWGATVDASKVPAGPPNQVN